MGMRAYCTSCKKKQWHQAAVNWGGMLTLGIPIRPVKCNTCGTPYVPGALDKVDNVMTAGCLILLSLATAGVIAVIVACYLLLTWIF